MKVVVMMLLIVFEVSATLAGVVICWTLITDEGINFMSILVSIMLSSFYCLSIIVLFSWINKEMTEILDRLSINE